jgi:aryl-alcohol dehydrogenase-like predicted oxidoreductase
MTTQSITAHSIFDSVPIGTGVWSWGDSFAWGYGSNYNEDDVRSAFYASLEAGITFFDTAESYGQGKSESLLGKFIRESGAQVTVATKFMPFPWRLSRDHLVTVLRKSLARLDLPKVQLYQMHWPLPLVPIEPWMDYMAETVHEGLAEAVGVSNYNREQMHRAYAGLAQRGVSLVSNQVEYSLLHRKPEKSGLLEDCRQSGILLIAYSPLAQGVLTGKYTPDDPPRGLLRGRRYNSDYLKKVQPLIALMRKIGAAHDGKTSAQVALNWVICKGALPIPGAKTAAQLQQNAGALGWQLSREEIAALDEASDAIQ